MKKKERIASLVSGLKTADDWPLDPHYTGYFTCFNAQQYYEAHDVLEHLWLQTKDENHSFYKGLIQIAGAFVHLQKQYLHPTHPKHGRRLRPATRLFQLGMHNLEGYRPRHMHLDIEALRVLCEGMVRKIAGSDYESNPWSPDNAPVLALE
jgi:hypothetical protein